MHSAKFAPIAIAALLGVAAWVLAETSPERTSKPLILIPTMVQELHELRVNTGERAVLGDGQENAVYVRKIPKYGHTYLNFHVEVASEGGSFVLRSEEIRLETAVGTRAYGPIEVSTGGKLADGHVMAYTPMDWFIDTGHEVRGDPLTVNDKADLQFTIEVPREGLADLVLFVHTQRIGSVAEIRERIAIDAATP